jgi:hypothetical protein
MFVCNKKYNIIIQLIVLHRAEYGCAIPVSFSFSFYLFFAVEWKIYSFLILILYIVSIVNNNIIWIFYSEIFSYTCKIALLAYDDALSHLNEGQRLFVVKR